MPQRSPQPNVNFEDAQLELSFKFWVIVLLTGVGVGVAGGLLMRLLFFVEHTAWHYDSGRHFLDGVIASSNARRIGNLALAGVLVGVVGTLLRKRFGKRGGGVEGAIWFHWGDVPFAATLAKATLSIIYVGLGTSLGRESPIKQTGGAVAAALARWLGLSARQQQLLVASGVGAGMSAAYNVPLGGGLFAAEVLLGSMSLQRVMPALAASVAATIASWLFLPTSPIYHIPEYQLSFGSLAWTILAGPIFGLAAVVIVRAIAWAESARAGGWAAVVSPLIVLTALGILAIKYPQLLGNGKDTVQLAFSDRFSFSLLLILPVLKLIATAACLRCGARGGLFTPTMTVGALLGGALGHMWPQRWGHIAPGSFAVIGASAVLAAASRGPVSSLVLVLELTRHADVLMAPMLLACGLATIVGGALESRSIYSSRALEVTDG